MNSGESLAFAVQLSGPDNKARRESASPERLLFVVVVVVLLSLTVILGVAPQSSEMASLDDPAFRALPSFETAIDDPADGAWNNAEGEWLACNGSDFPDLVGSAEAFVAAP